MTTPTFDPDEIVVWDDPNAVLDPFPLFAAVTSATLPDGRELVHRVGLHPGRRRTATKIVYWQLYGVDDPRTSG